MEGLLDYNSDEDDAPQERRKIEQPAVVVLPPTKKQKVNIVLSVNTKFSAQDDAEDKPMKKAMAHGSSLSSMLPPPKNLSSAKTKTTSTSSTPSFTPRTIANQTLPSSTIQVQAKLKKQLLDSNAKNTKRKAEEKEEKEEEEEPSSFFPLDLLPSSTTTTTTSSSPSPSQDHATISHIPTHNYYVEHSNQYSQQEQGQQEQEPYQQYDQYQAYEQYQQPYQPPLPPSSRGEIPRDFEAAFQGAQMKEISQKSIIGEVSYTQKHQYDNKLSVATPSVPKPTQLQRRRHQLSSLVYEAQLKELELQDRKAASKKTKAETRGKYGW